MAVNTGKIQGKHREFKPERDHPVIAVGTILHQSGN